MVNIFKRLRIAKNETLQTISDNIGLSILTLNKLELFKVKNVRISTAIKLAEYYSCTPDELLNTYEKEYKEYIKNQEE